MGAKAPDAGPAVSPGTLNPPGALTRPGCWSKPTQPAWGPQTPGHRPSGLHLTPLPASSRGPARATAEAQPEPRTGQWAWRGRRADSGALTAGRERGEPRGVPGRESRALEGAAGPQVGALPPRGERAGSWEGRKPSWLPATLQPHNGVILPGHRMPFVGQRPAAQPQGRQWGWGAGAASQGPLALLGPHRRVLAPHPRRPEGQPAVHIRLHRPAAPAALAAHAACTLPASRRLRARWQPCPPQARGNPAPMRGPGSLPPLPGLLRKGRGPPAQADPATGPAAASRCLPRTPNLGHASAPTAVST